MLRKTPARFDISGDVRSSMVIFIRASVNGYSQTQIVNLNLIGFANFYGQSDQLFYFPEFTSRLDHK